MGKVNDLVDLIDYLKGWDNSDEVIGILFIGVWVISDKWSWGVIW